MKITCQERIGEDGEPVSVPVIPPSTTVDEIDEIVAAEGAAVKLRERRSCAETAAVVAEDGDQWLTSDDACVAGFWR